MFSDQAHSSWVSLTRVTKSYLLALGTTQISSFFSTPQLNPKHNWQIELCLSGLTCINRYKMFLANHVSCGVTFLLGCCRLYTPYMKEVYLFMDIARNINRRNIKWAVEGVGSCTAKQNVDRGLAHGEHKRVGERSPDKLRTERRKSTRNEVGLIHDGGNQPRPSYFADTGVATLSKRDDETHSP